jgi:tetratricopeptide (TPR) repeat protein
VKGHNKVAALIISVALLLPLLASAGQRHDRLLDQGLKSDEPYSFSLGKRALSSPAAEKIKLLDEAISYSPDLPALYFSRALASFPNVFTSVNYLLEGAKAYRRNFWWSLSLKGLLYVSSMVSLLLALLAAAVVRFQRDIPLLAHEINEKKIKIFLPLVPVALSPLGPVAFIAGILVVTGIYLRKGQKALVYLSLLLMLTLPFSQRLLNYYFSAPTPHLRAIVSVAEGKDNAYALEALRDREDFASRFSYATALKRTGGYSRAIAVFEEISKERKDPRAYTNLGSAYMAANRKDLAKEAYKKAVELGGKVVPLYNLSQVYRDELNYGEGDAYYDKAVSVDRDRVSEFTAVISGNPNRFVVDENLSGRDFEALAWKDPKTFISLAPVDAMYLSIASIVLLLLFVAIDRMAEIRAFRCSGCSRILCPKCTQGRHMGQLCPDCLMAARSPEDKGPKAKVANMLSSLGQKRRMKIRVRVISFILPGLAHIYMGRVISGVLMLWLFLFMALAMALNPLFLTGMAESSHGWLMPPMAVMCVIIYFISVIAAGRKLERGWL